MSPPNDDLPADAPAEQAAELPPGAPRSKSPKSAKPASPARRAGLPRVLLALVFGLLLGRYACAPAPGVAHDPAESAAAEATIWTCAMHPQIRLPGPGACPICAMDLIPVRTDSGDADAGPRSLVLSEAAAALAEIVTAPVERRAVSHEVRMVGRVTYDETRMASLTAWIPGRLDRLFVDYTGVTVRAGDHLVEIYSPDLIVTQKELIQAIETERVLSGSASSIVSERQAASVASARERLRLWGLSQEQIDAIAEGGEPLEHVTINAPIGGVVVHKNALEGSYVETGTEIYTIADLTRVWVELDAYESDLTWLHYGQALEFSAQAYPGRVFEGRIAFIEPVLNDRTRTVRVRVNIENPDLALKPDMFVRAVVDAEIGTGGRPIDTELAGQWMCPMHPEVLAAGPDSCEVCGMDLVPVEELGFSAERSAEVPLVIPRTAPLITGKRAVVYVRVPGRERPTFEGREVVLGPRAGDWYVVDSGLEEGELVVVHGNFKLDSELQIRGKPSMMSPDGGAPTTGHQHGGASTHEASALSPTGSFEGVPDAFRRQLGGVVDASLALHAALAGDDTSALAARSEALEHALHGVDMSLLAGPAHVSWMLALPELDGAVASLAAATGLEKTRAAFLDLQLALASALDRFGYASAAGEVSLFHCPMAFDGAGGQWLQAGDDTLNPYFGAQMLRCGDAVRAIPGER